MYMRNNRTERIRRSAAECLELAKATPDERAKRTLIRLAEVWTKLVDQRFLAGQVETLVDMLDTTAVPREPAISTQAD
jgi:hypothetical protein